jgi:hypothetical protein
VACLDFLPMKSTLCLLATLTLAALPSYGQSSGGTLYIGGGSGTTNTNSTYSVVIFDRAESISTAPALSLADTAKGSGSSDAIPEPASASLLALGAVALVSRRRRSA